MRCGQPFPNTPVLQRSRFFGLLLTLLSTTSNDSTPPSTVHQSPNSRPCTEDVCRYQRGRPKHDLPLASHVMAHQITSTTVRFTFSFFEAVPPSSPLLRLTNICRTIFATLIMITIETQDVYLVRGRATASVLPTSCSYRFYLPIHFYLCILHPLAPRAVVLFALTLCILASCFLTTILGEGLGILNTLI